MPRRTKVQGAYLPHWREIGATYFITFRLAHSLPSFSAQDRAWKRKGIVTDAIKMRRPLTIWELDELEDLHFRDLDLQRFDRKACFLSDERIAKITADALLYFQNKRYHLFAWCIMPNHVHTVVQPFPGWEVSNILHSWKRFSARQANQLLHQTGAFWQEEYYDHLIRDAADLQRCIDYTWMNPEKAGLQGWQWRGKETQEVSAPERVL